MRSHSFFVSIGLLLATACADPPSPIKSSPLPSKPKAAAAAKADAAAPAAKAAPGTAAPTTGADAGALILQTPSGQIKIRLKSPGKLALEGAITGTAKFDDERLKLQDDAGKPRAKVKRKEGAIKLYDGAGEALYKIKKKGDRFKVKRGDTVVGEIRGDRAVLQGKPFTLTATLNSGVVKSGDTQLLSLSHGLQALKTNNSALFVILPDLDPYQQAAIASFLLYTHPNGW